MTSATYDRFCARAYSVVRSKLAPHIRNSQYRYAETLRGALEKHGRWLDLGCGHEFLPSWMPHAERSLDLEGWTPIGIDMDASALDRHPDLRWRVQGNIERLPFRNHTFNLITANMVIEHVENPAALLTEIGRVLDDQGVLIIHTPNVAGYTTILTKLIPRALVIPLASLLLGREPADVYPTFYRANSIDTLQNDACRADLSPVAFGYIDSSPQFVRVPPLMAVELMLLRLLQKPGRSKYRACILATFSKRRMHSASQNS